jgi:16S rRNA (guanine527-N7)-methyltransferase
MSDAYRIRLEAGISSLGLTLAGDVVTRLLEFHALLVKWNKAYNLTSVRNADEMIDRHLLDSLSMLPFIGPGALLDVGTGAGFPGMVLALVRPDLPVWLLDSNGKKTRFLSQVKMMLKVDNVTVVQHRLESWQPERQFAQITSRAFATLSDMVSFARHLLCDDGRFLAMKGLSPDAELAQLPPDIKLLAISPLTVPGTDDGQRHLVELGLQTPFKD